MIHIYNETKLSNKKDIMPFVAAWKNLETVIVNKVIQRKPNIYHLYVESKKKKNGTNGHHAGLTFGAHTPARLLPLDVS